VISSRVSGAREAAKAFLAASSVASAKTSAAAAYHGKRYQAAVKRRASGRPGPNIITKRYNNSIQFRMVQTGPIAVAEVYTNHPAAHRLEVGFVGVDSAGRTVDAPPYPHWDPDFMAAADGLQRSMAAIVDVAGASHLL
jgi:hypothetical protein